MTAANSSLMNNAGTGNMRAATGYAFSSKFCLNDMMHLQHKQRKTLVLQMLSCYQHDDMA